MLRSFIEANKASILEGESPTLAMLQAMHTEKEREREREKTVDSVVLPCPSIVNTEYLQRHDRVASFIQRILS